MSDDNISTESTNNDLVSSIFVPPIEIVDSPQKSHASYSVRTHKIQNYSTSNKPSNIDYVYELNQLPPTYSVFVESNLLHTDFLKNSFDEIFDNDLDLSPNSTLSANTVKRWRWGVYWTPGCGFIIYKIFNKEITVPPGHTCCFTDENDNYLFARPGIYNIQNPFLKQVTNPIPLYGSSKGHRTVIQHGDRTVLTVPMGMLGYATDRGNPILLPPGLHAWKSDTIRFEQMYNLAFEGPTLNIGPYTVLIVPEGSVAVTQENGKKKLLDGGKSYILTHTLWSFEYLIDMSIQSDTYQGLGLMSADNIKLSVITNYVWKVVDSKVAARVISSSSLSSKVEVEETDNLVDADKSTLQQFEKIRYHTLNQVKGAVASFIGRLQYAQRFIQHAKNADKSDHKNEYNDMDDDNTYSLPHQTSSSFNNHLFDYLSWDKEMNETNKITKTFGVELVSIKIIKYIPVDERVQQSLTNAVLLSSETLQQEEKALLSARTMKIEAEADALANKIHAESEANAILIRAKAEAEAEILKSDGDKVAEITRAEGMKEAALLLESSKVAITLEAMKISATALRNSDKFYFCQEPEFMANLLMRGQEHGSSHLFSNDS